MPLRVKRAQWVHGHVTPKLGPHILANSARRLCVDAAVAKRAYHGFKPRREFAARLAEQQPIDGDNFDVCGGQHACRGMHHGSQRALPRKGSLLKTAGVDRLETSVVEPAAEILEEPPGNAVGAADDHARGSYQRH